MRNTSSSVTGQRLLGFKKSRSRSESERPQLSASMPILSRYVKKNALFAIVAAILGLWGLQLVFSYLSELESLSDSYTMSDVLKYILYRSPYFLEQFIPTGALLGAVVGLGLLANKSELIVMRAAGVSILRIVAWVLQPAMIFVVIALMINQFVLPVSNQLANDLHDDGRKSSLVTSVRGYWTVQPRYVTAPNSTADNPVANIDGKDVLYIDYADTDGNLGEVKRWHLDNNGNLESAIRAESGVFTPQKGEADPAQMYEFEWTLRDKTELTINQGRDTSQSRKAADVLRLPFAPESVYLLTRKADDLSLTQLYEHRQFMKAQGNRSLEHELAFWQKLLSPLAILSLVIVACSFVFGSLRTHSLGLRIVVALLFGLMFSYFQDLVGFVSLATGVSPLLMVLLPILGSAALGFYLIKRQM